MYQWLFLKLCARFLYVCTTLIWSGEPILHTLEKAKNVTFLLLWQSAKNKMSTKKQKFHRWRSTKVMQMSLGFVFSCLLAPLSRAGLAVVVVCDRSIHPSPNPIQSFSFECSQLLRKYLMLKIYLTLPLKIVQDNSNNIFYDSRSCCVFSIRDLQWIQVERCHYYNPQDTTLKEVILRAREQDLKRIHDAFDALDPTAFKWRIMNVLMSNGKCILQT